MTAKAEREARLAAQLRANLRKRKAYAPGTTGDADQPATLDQRLSSADPTESAADAAR